MLLVSLALAGELNFASDRPGVGDATSTVGAGHAMVQLGVAAAFTDPLAVGTSSWIGRVGLADGVEARVRAPDVVIAGGEVNTGSMGLGATVGGALNDTWSVSVVPELTLLTDGGDVYGTVNSNLAATVDALSLWGHASTSFADRGVSTLVGGGIGFAFAQGGVYGNGGHTFGADPFVGIGGWWMLADALQLDLGCDITLAGGDAVPVLLGGISIGF